MRRLSVYLLLLTAPVVLRAQGMLPGSKAPEQIVASSETLRIGDSVSMNVGVLDLDRNARTFLSYKSVLQALVVVFVDKNCPGDNSTWRALDRLEKNYRDWKVAFLAIDPVKGASMTQMQEMFDRRKLGWSLARDPEGDVARLFNIQKLPTLLIVDESGYLRYRGPVEKAEKALKTVISHIDPLLDAEPAVVEGCSL